MEHFWSGFQKEAETDVELEKQALWRQLGKAVSRVGNAPKTIGKVVEKTKSAPRKMFDSALGKFHLGRAEAKGVSLGKYHAERAKAKGLKPDAYKEKYKGQLEVGHQIAKKERDAAAAIATQKATEEAARKKAFKQQQIDAGIIKPKKKSSGITPVKAALGGTAALAAGAAIGVGVANRSGDEHQQH